MKPITEKQINAIQKLARATRTEVNNIEGMSSLEASRVITALLEKRNGVSPNPARKESNKADDFVAGALAGLAIKTVAQRCHVEEILGSEAQFKQQVVELYKVFSEARQECLA